MDACLFPTQGGIYAKILYGISLTLCLKVLLTDALGPTSTYSFLANPKNTISTIKLYRRRLLPKEVVPEIKETFGQSA